MKKIFKNPIFTFILGVLISSGVVYAVNILSANVEYDNSQSGIEATTVEGAINELYKGVEAKLPLNTFDESLIAQTRTYQHPSSVSLDLTKGKYLIVLSYGIGSHGPKTTGNTARISPQIDCASNNCIQSVITGYTSYSYGAAAYKSSDGYLYNSLSSALLYVDVLEENDTITFNRNGGTNNYCSLVLTLQAIPINE